MADGTEGDPLSSQRTGESPSLTPGTRRAKRESERAQQQRYAIKKAADRKAFGDRFDTHIKRWQTVAALIVALGAICGFVGNKMGWHLPSLVSTDSAPPAITTADLPTRPPPGQDVTNRVRYLDKRWSNRVDLDGTNPIFQVSAGYYNISGGPKDDVVAQLQYDSRLTPIKGTTVLKNSDNPNGLAITDPDALVNTWMNIGNYEDGANAYVNISFTLNSSDFPCGDTTMTVRTIVRDVAFEDAEHDKFSPEAIVVYHKKCG